MFNYDAAPLRALVRAFSSLRELYLIIALIRLMQLRESKNQQRVPGY